MRKKIARLLITAAALLLSASLPAASVQASGGTEGKEKLVVGYYANWSAYDGYTPKSLPADRLTHINYAFAKIDPATGRLAMANPDIDGKNFQELGELKRKYPGLRVLISVGGWDYSGQFSAVAATEQGREVFAQSCAEFVAEHGLDGVDLDWEYPVSGGPAGNGSSPADRENFTRLLDAVRKKLDRQGAADGKRYELTIAGAASASYLKKIEPVKVASLVDFIFVMAYDMHGPWDGFSDLSAPLSQPSGCSPQYKNSVADGIAAYDAAGVPRDKLVLGMPFYGYVYEGVNVQETAPVGADVSAGKLPGMYSPFRAARSMGFDAIRSRYLSDPSMKRMFHREAAVPVLYGDSVFVSYEDPASITAKAAFAAGQGLAGVGIWELSHNRSGELLESALAGLRAGNSSLGR